MESIWIKDVEKPDFPEIEGSHSTDVLIIGGGITGLLTAYLLQQKGIDYIVVEKDRICGGTTQNTTAKITYQHSLIYSKLFKSEGVEKAQGYLLANKKAFKKITQLCGETDCDFEYEDNFVYSVSDRKKLEDEMFVLDKIGYTAKLIDSVPLPIKTVGAVCFEKQAQFHPLKFLYSISKGLNIYENSFVKKAAGTKAITDKAEINAKAIVVTTHFPFIDRHGSYFLKLYQHRSYVSAFEDAAEVNGMYVDESDTGLSFRNYKNFLLLGGGGHRTGKEGGNWAELRNFAAEHYPQAKEKYFWATQDCMSLDSIPYIGNYSKITPHILTASGFCKWGMTGSMLAAIMLTDMITGRNNDFQELFSPSRNMLKPQLMINGFESAKNLLTLSPKRCPHMGCALKWNRAENSWDCPCHGSRFDRHGKILENPANTNMNSP